MKTKKVLGVALAGCLLASCGFAVTACGEGKPWGEEANVEWYNTTDTQFVIDTPQELAGLAKLTNEGTTFAGKTIKLGADIDLGNREWTPIGYGSNPNEYSFDGIFDGQNYTISNLKLTEFVGGSSEEGATQGVGLFGNTDQAQISDVNLENVKVEGNHFVGGLIGWSSYTTISGCSIDEAYISCTYDNEEDSGDKAGALVGLLMNSIATNCSATDAAISTGRDGGQLFGCTSGATTFTGCEVSSVVVTHNGTGNGAYIINDIVGNDRAIKPASTKAFIGNVNYDSLDEALEAVENGQIVRLTAGEHETTQNFNLASKTVTILGHYSGSSIKATSTGKTENAGISISSATNSILRVINVIFTGTDGGSRGICFSNITTNENNRVVIEDCTFNIAGIGLYLGGSFGNSYIKNTTFNSNFCGFGIDNFQGQLTIEDCTFNTCTHDISWTGTGSVKLIDSPCSISESAEGFQKHEFDEGEHIYTTAQ